jgi:hypothetical protein
MFWMKKWVNPGPLPVKMENHINKEGAMSRVN